MKCLLKNKELSKNPHKCVIIWASKAHKMINVILRQQKTLINLDTKSYKYIKIFLDEFLFYFKTHGVTKDALGCKTLYRGLTKMVMTENIRDYTFMSTSKDKDIADSFAGRDGCVIKLSTKHLPLGVPFVIIDDTICDYMHENEVLLLPGTITMTSNVKGAYNVDKDVYEYMTQLTQGGGGEVNWTELLSIPNIDLKGKYVVWWRAIKDMPVEILSYIQLPNKSDKQVIAFWKEYVDPKDRRYEEWCDYIPRYKYIMDKTPESRTKAERDELSSYSVYMAIYDKKQNKIDHYHYGVFDVFAKEIGYDANMEKEVFHLVQNCWGLH